MAGSLSNFAMGAILGMGFPQAQVHTVHSTSAEGTSACGKPIPKIAPMAKLHSLLKAIHYTSLALIVACLESNHFEKKN